MSTTQLHIVALFPDSIFSVASTTNKVEELGI